MDCVSRGPIEGWETGGSRALRAHQDRVSCSVRATVQTSASTKVSLPMVPDIFPHGAARRKGGRERGPPPPSLDSDRPRRKYMKPMKKLIFVTGGVCSSLGKGVGRLSIGCLWNPGA
jgi:hypothetical protein